MDLLLLLLLFNAIRFSLILFGLWRGILFLFILLFFDKIEILIGRKQSKARINGKRDDD